jgi:hypothetical protein
MAQNLERGKIIDSIRQASPPLVAGIRLFGGLCAKLLYQSTALACPDLCNGDIVILRTNASRYLLPLDSLIPSTGPGRSSTFSGQDDWHSILPFGRSGHWYEATLSGTGKYLVSLQDAISREEGLQTNFLQFSS